ncbi:MAG: OsmC family protein [Gemmatimonadota bacterium]
MEARGIPSHGGALVSHVTGEIGTRDGVLRIRRIRLRYEIRIPPGKREAVDRALAHHVSKCPVAQTLMPCVQIEWEAEVREHGDEHGSPSR